MSTKALVRVEKGCDVWVLQYRDEMGTVVVEQTKFPSNTPSLLVCDALQEERPDWTLLAKLS